MRRMVLLALAASAMVQCDVHGESLESAFSAARQAAAAAKEGKPSPLPPPPRFQSSAPAQDPRRALINGTPVAPGTFTEVVRIRTGNSGCTATVVGPRVIMTAAHCGATGAVSKFEIAGATYSATLTRSPLYPGKDHDIALGVTTVTIRGVQPVSIGGTASVGAKIILLGYGCTQPGGGGGNDGILRKGESEITRFSGFDMVSSLPGGGALCFGDSGGPAFIEEGGRLVLLGVNSKGNIRDTNWNARLDSTESKDFLRDFAQQNNVEICGVNLAC